MSGKEPRSKNAFKHGAYSREVLLPHESRRDYNQLLADTRAEWSPDGPTEELLVGRLVDLMWRQMRVKRYEDAHLQRRIEIVRQNNDGVPARAALQAMAPEFAQADTPEKVDKLLKKYKPYARTIVTWIPRPTDSEKEAGWGAAIGEYLKNLKVGEVIEGPSEVTTFVDPFDIEVQEDRMGRLDERISQLIKRLVQIKASKQMFGARNGLSKMIPARSPGLAGRGPVVEHERSGNAHDAEVATQPSKQNWWLPGPIDYRRSRINEPNKQPVNDPDEEESSGAVFTVPASS